jgi:hypothetical protein
VIDIAGECCSSLMQEASCHTGKRLILLENAVVLQHGRRVRAKWILLENAAVSLRGGALHRGGLPGVLPEATIAGRAAPDFSL